MGCGSKLAWPWVVRLLSVVVLILTQSCLVTDLDPSPNRNSPPRILMPGVANSMTTPPDRVFLVAALPTAGRERDVYLTMDVADDDTASLTYRVFVIGPAEAGLDAGMNDDAGTSLSGFVRRFAISGSIPLANGRGLVSPIVITGDHFAPTGRCYGVEVRISSAFRDASNGTAPELPASNGDISSIVYWVASYGPTDTAIDLASCPSQP